MVCPCCIPPGPCVACCPEWTLPGGVGDVPDEIQVELTIGPYDRCYVLGFATIFGGLRFATIFDTVSYSGTITLVRVSASGDGCGRWAYDNCDGTERVRCEVRLVVVDGECFWNTEFSYSVCKPSPDCAAAVSPSTIQTICCDNTPGFVAAVAVSNQSKAMPAQCQGAEDDGSVVDLGGPFGIGGNWGTRCNTAGTFCLLNTCGADTQPETCPDNITVPFSYKIIP
jgi:hypothetical protein